MDKEIKLPLWEEEYREELERIVPDGMFNVSTNGMTIYTGKMGFINFSIEIYKSIIDKSGIINSNTMSLKAIRQHFKFNL